MKNIIGYIMASAALASAQVTYNETDGSFTCAVPDKAYCAGDSLKTDIIIRCNGTKGQPGRCTNNLAGYPPLGVNPALCFQSSPTAGDAACEKNCVVYAPSSSFTLPASVCTPYYTATSSSSGTSYSATSTSSATSEYTSKTTVTATSDCETTASYKPTYPPHGHNTTVTVPPTGHTPKPTTTPSPTSPTIPTAGATANQAVGALAIVGIIAAWFL